MGQKVVCLECKISFNQDIDCNNRKDTPCPDCGKIMIFLPHRFRPPLKRNDKEWAVVKFLVNHGFYYQHIYEKTETSNHVNRIEKYVSYPNHMREAKEFVEKYKQQAIKKK
jgi:predicted RNA-binding Zn-ribbon protein involved in translation (DUF1610 family)